MTDKPLGALTATAMFLNGWTPVECTSKIRELSKVAFHNGPLTKFPLVAAAGKVIMYLLKDSIYTGRKLGHLLQDIFGDRKMLDWSYANSIGTKIALPVATQSEPSTLVFTNYNGIGDDIHRQGIRLYCTKSKCFALIIHVFAGYQTYQDHEDVKVWEV